MDTGDVIPESLHASDWDDYLNNLRQGPPTSLRCVVCTFETEIDDCRVLLPHGVICERCHNRVAEDTRYVPKLLRHQIEALLEGKG